MAAVDPLVSQYLSGPAGLNNSGIDPRVLRYLTNRDPNALPTDQPPVIPDIAKAYVNDPRTQLAINAIKTGTSTDPVARGKYGIADGIARALTATLGGYVNKQQEAKYAQQQQGLIESRRANNQDPLTGTAVNTAPTTTTPDTTSSSLPPVGGTMPVAGGPSGMSSVPPPASAGTPPPDPTALSLTGGAPITSDLASQIAGATGVPAPPPATPAPGMAAGIPQGPIPTGQAPPPPAPPVPTGLSPQPGGPPVQVAPIGGSSQSTGPFSQGSGTSAPTGPVSPSTTTSGVPTSPTTPAAAVAAKAGTTTPGVAVAAKAASKPAGEFDVPQVSVPDIPQEFQNIKEPDVPTAPAAKVSTLLQTARQMIQTGNPYDSDRAQTMLSEGLKEQDTLNQAAQDFANEVTLKQYGSKLDLYSRFKGAELDAALKARSDAQQANYENARQSITNALEWRKSQAQNATTIQAANIAASSEAARTKATIAAEYGLERMKEAAALNQIDEKRRFFFASPAGLAASQKAEQSNNIARQGLAKLSEYQDILNKGGVGGGIRALANAAINPFDATGQRISGLSNDLALIASNFQKNGGRGSNLQLKTIMGGKPGLDVLPVVQQQRVNSMRDAFLKSIEYNNAIMDNQALGGNPADLERDFSAYEAANPVIGPNQRFVGFNEWKAARQAASSGGAPSSGWGKVTAR